MGNSGKREGIMRGVKEGESSRYILYSYMKIEKGNLLKLF
jgi:hypothetical protein